MYDQGYLGHTINPAHLIGCCEWTPVQPCTQGYFYVLYQYLIQPTKYTGHKMDCCKYW